MLCAAAGGPSDSVGDIYELTEPLRLPASANPYEQQERDVLVWEQQLERGRKQREQGRRGILYYGYFRQDLDTNFEFAQLRIMRFQSFPGRFSIIFMSRDQFFRKRWVGSTPISAVDPTVCGKPDTPDGPRSTRVVHGYGDFMDHPFNLPVSASGMLRCSTLQRVDVVASTMPRSCQCESKESWQMPPMDRNMLADHH